jgi:hypothetical protein
LAVGVEDGSVVDVLVETKMLAGVESQYQFRWRRYKELELEIGMAILPQTELKK